jgi:hypothetical protein
MKGEPMPHLSPSLASAEQRAWRAWYADGVPTLMTGLTCLIVALSLFFNRDRHLTIVSVVVSLLILLLYFSLILFQRQIIEWLKFRISYPRTGYAVPPGMAQGAGASPAMTTLSLDSAKHAPSPDVEKLRAEYTRRLYLAGGAAILAVFSLLLVQNRWVCFAAGAVMAAAIWIATRGEERLPWLLLLGFPIGGLWMSLFLADHVFGADRSAYYLAISGILFLLEGAVTLVVYLRQNPRPAPPHS